MGQNKPRCADFIIAAARTIRPNPANLKPNTAAGVRLGRIWDVASDAYDDAEFREGVRELIADGRVLISSRVYFSDGSACDMRVKALPKKLPKGEYNRWYVNSKEEYFVKVEKGGPKKYRTLRYILLHVKEDGFSGTAERLANPQRSRKTAQDIITDMQTK